MADTRSGQGSSGTNRADARRNRGVRARPTQDSGKTRDAAVALADLAAPQAAVANVRVGRAAA